MPLGDFGEISDASRRFVRRTASLHVFCGTSNGPQFRGPFYIHRTQPQFRAHLLIALRLHPGIAASASSWIDPGRSGNWFFCSNLGLQGHQGSAICAMDVSYFCRQPGGDDIELRPTVIIICLSLDRCVATVRIRLLAEISVPFRNKVGFSVIPPLFFRRCISMDLTSFG